MDNGNRLFGEKGRRMLKGGQGQRDTAELHSAVVEAIRNGHAGIDGALQSAGYSHQVMKKPNGPEAVTEILGESSIVAELRGDERMRYKITEIGALPTIPRIYNKMVYEFRLETGSLKNVADIISSDPEMTSAILGLVNSNYFNFHIKLKSPLHALNLLGFDIISALVLFEGVFSQFAAEGPAGDFIECVHDHSLAAGIGAYKISKSIPLKETFPLDSFVAGLLHDVGKIIMLAYFRDRLNEAVTAVEDRLVPLHEVEYEIIGITHAFIGAYLLTLWGLSNSVIEAVALHHMPRKSTHPVRGVLAAVHIADVLEHEQKCNSIQDRVTGVDIEYLKDTGVFEILPRLKDECMIGADLEAEKIGQAK